MASQRKPKAGGKAKAVFLDRDGTIIHDRHHLTLPREIRLLPRAAHAIRMMKEAGFLVIIITNQAVIAHGMSTKKGVDRVHAVLVKRLKKRGALVDAVYYCPHHPKGKIKKYRLKCSCRKPNTGMIKEAIKKFKTIDVEKSFLVGDATSDILAGKRAGLTTILVKTGFGGRDGKHVVVPDIKVKNILEAARAIKAWEKKRK